MRVAEALATGLAPGNLNLLFRLPVELTIHLAPFSIR